MTYFRMGNPHYHRRAAVSRSCSRWEGVGPAGYGRQTLIFGEPQHLRRAHRAGSSKGLGLIGANAARAMRSVMGSSRTGN